MTPRGRILAPAAALAAAAALAGCGSSAPTKAEFVKKADAICAQTNKAHPPKPEPKSLKDAAGMQAEEIAIRRDLDKRLKGLDVPDKLKKDFAAYNAGTTRVLATFAKGEAAAKAGNRSEYEAALTQVNQAAVERENAAKKLGFRVCGRQNPAQ